MFIRSDLLSANGHGFAPRTVLRRFDRPKLIETDCSRIPTSSASQFTLGSCIEYIGKFASIFISREATERIFMFQTTSPDDSASSRRLCSQELPEKKRKRFEKAIPCSAQIPLKCLPSSPIHSAMFGLCGRSDRQSRIGRETRQKFDCLAIETARQGASWNS